MTKLNIHGIFIVFKIIHIMIIVIILIPLHIITNKLNIFQHRLLY